MAGQPTPAQRTPPQNPPRNKALLRTHLPYKSTKCRQVYQSHGSLGKKQKTYTVYILYIVYILYTWHLFQKNNGKFKN